MSHITVKKVENNKEIEDFIRLPHILYKDSNKYVPDMDSDVKNTLNPNKNENLKHVEIQAFIVYKNDQCVGRVAGIINHQSNEVWKKDVVRFSMIEFIDDDDVSQALIEAVEEWGAERGMNAIQGPMGITDFDKEGMLIEDFELGGSFIEIWNPPYYVEHMQNMGFTKDADWLQIRIDVPNEVPARFVRVAEYAREELGVHIAHRTKKELYGEYGKQIFKLVNAAYAPLFGFAPFNEKQADDFLHQYVPLLDLDMVAFIENTQEELVGIAVTIQDPSEGIRKAKGKLLPFGWWHLLKTLKIKKSKKAQLLIIAIKPELQGMGVNALIFDYLIPVYNQKGITWCETGPQLDTNTKELSQWKVLKPEMVKRRRCWVKNISSKN